MMYGQTVEQNEDKDVTISAERYEELLSSEKMLNALHMAGVDNWAGMDEALDILNDEGV